MIALSCKKTLEDKCNDYLGIMGFRKIASAMDFNAYGFKYYKEKEYKKAAELFQCAINKNKKLAVAYYNRACMLSLQYGKNKLIKKSEIFRLLHETLHLNPRYLDRIKKDKDFAPIKHLNEFKLIINNESNIKKYIEANLIGSWKCIIFDNYNFCRIKKMRFFKNKSMNFTIAVKNNKPMVINGTYSISSHKKRSYTNYYTTIKPVKNIHSKEIYIYRMRFRNSNRVNFEDLNPSSKKEKGMSSEYIRQ